MRRTLLISLALVLKILTVTSLADEPAFARQTTPLSAPAAPAPS